MNSSYSIDGMNTEKYHKVKMMNRKQTERAIRSNAFMDEQRISEDNYMVQMNPKHCSCKTPLQIAFFVLDNAKQSLSPKFILQQITLDNIFAVFNKQIGRQAIKKILFFE
ncbi:MAG: hypothetical protein EZS28_022549 [Streblomastix strix]|uniref:Uncharacterized protein n=1 Tax=Streblomastix strix TaxID=222440 RepID=A0A5J4VH73_9EUKA|nr:MAG: hypothetical protein EZS28_022549 [Streblomastix strix]